VYKTLSVLDVVAVKDSASAIVVKTVPASDYIGFDSVTYIVVKTVPAYDYIGFDSVTYTKSYSPLFFTLFQRRVPIVYKTLSVLDIVAVRDGASVIPIKVVSVLDVVPVADRVDVKNIAISVSDYVVYDSASAAKIEVVSMLDVVAVKDSASVIPIRVVSVFDSMVVSDHATAKMISIPVSDYIMYDSVVPISYVALSVFDIISLPDSASVVARKVVSVLDVVPVADRVDVKNIAISVSDFIMYDSVVPVRYAVLSVLDIVSLPDSVSMEAKKVVSVSDFVMYDYVPSMSPSSIRYRSLYANVGMRTISVFDRITPYESVWVGPRVVTVNARDYLVSDGATVIKRSVHAYDVVVVWENVNIVRL